VDDAPGKSPGTDNISLNLEFTDNDILNSRLSVKAYYQDYETRFGFATYFPGGGGQSFLSSEKFGSRLNIKTPIDQLPGSYLQWGADYLTDETSQPLVDGREWVPPITQSSIAPFAQLKIQPSEKLILRGGLRYENISLDVENFTTLFGGNDVAGGDLNYDALVANTGIVYFLNDIFNVYGSFSQAFSVSDVGRELRGTTASSVEQLNPEAQKVNNYETGIRASGNFWAATVSGYINTSDLGTTFSGGNDFSIVRSPEIVRGFETTLDLQVRRDLEVGGTLSLVEGKRDSDDDGNYDTFLTGDRIPPTKVTGYLSYEPLNGLNTRLDIMYSGNRNKFPGSTSFAQGEVNSYTVVDLSAGYKVGPGTLSLGIENLLNKQYFPTISQWYNLGGVGYSAGRGRIVSLGYQ
ncbi:MAG: TonB-dependent receptor, partial [Candidatus Halalkalibacterium sp. M3_1C_030]